MENTEDRGVAQNSENLTLGTAAEDVAASIMQEKDPEKLKKLVQLFNINLARKSVTRSLSLSNLLDHVTGQMEERLVKKADEFSNTDLITYLKVIQDSLDKSSKAMDQVNETPVINFTQTNNTVNIGAGESSDIDRESRERIMDAVSAYLASIKGKEEVYEAPYEEASTDTREEESEDKNAE